MQAGDLGVLDLSSPVLTEATEARRTTLVVPRSVMKEAVGGYEDLGGGVVSRQAPMVGIVRDHLVSLESWLPHLSAADASHLARVTVDLLAAAISPTTKHLARARRGVDSIVPARVRQYVRNNLGSADLSPQMLADRFGLSRAALYRIFEEHGGVRSYIREQRLAACFEALRDPSKAHLSIEKLAEQHGFPCAAHFWRLFRRRYGVTPLEARRNGVAASRDSAGRAGPHLWLPLA